MLIKAGTYRFNDVLTEAEFNQDIDFEYSGVIDGVSGGFYCSNMQGGASSGDVWLLSFYIYKIIEDGVEEVGGANLTVYGGNWIDAMFLYPHTIPKDTEVDDTFGTWYKANTDYNTVNGSGESVLGLRRFVDNPDIASLSDIVPAETLESDLTDFYMEYTCNGVTYNLLIGQINEGAAGGYGLLYFNDKDVEICNPYLTTDGWDAEYGDGVRNINITKAPQSTELKTWLLANTEAVEETPTVTRKFTRLYLGATVYSSNGKRFRKLQTEEYVEPSEPETESVVGTWVFNSTFIDTPSDYTVNDINGTFYIPNDFTTDYYFIETSIDRILFSNNSILVYRKSNTYMNNVRGDGTATCYYYKYNSWDYSPLPYNVEDVLARTITITEEPTDETFKTWLLANATRVEDSIIGTWVFKPTIDLSTSFAMHINFTGELSQVGYVGNFECEIIVVNSSGIFYRPIGASSAYQAYSIHSQDWKDYEYRRTITITGGADIENKEFITWLNANATKQELPLWNGTDLNGTTWLLNETVSVNSSSPPTVDVDFISGNAYSDGTTQYGKIEGGFQLYNKYYSVRYVSIGTSQGGQDSYSQVYDSNSKWGKDSYRTVSFNGGDTTNTRLISWLKANGTLTSHTMPQEETESIEGTWKLNNVPSLIDDPIFINKGEHEQFDCEGEFTVFENGTYNTYTMDRVLLTYQTLYLGYAYGTVGFSGTYNNLSLRVMPEGNHNRVWGRYSRPNNYEWYEWVNETTDNTVTFFKDIDSQTLKSWLKANATKQ